MRINRSHIGLYIAAAIIGVLLANVVFADDTVDFAQNEVNRRESTLNAITPDIQRLYCLPRVADLTKKKELRTQLNESVEAENAKIDMILEDCVGSFIATFPKELTQ
jgi:capsule polysaccharide export protein KpsE/RkpR|tara:strand:+ start:859 stop:1179 length:321 start_codon:yes stop_codon:yes gene_type:complete